MVDLYTIAPLYVIAPGTIVGDYYSLDNVARLIMRSMGSQTSTILKQMALEGLVEGLEYFKATSHMRFLSGTETEVQLTDGDATVALDADTWALVNVTMEDRTNVEQYRARRITYVLWDQLHREYDMNAEASIPTRWSLYDLAVAKELLVWPTPKDPQDLWLKIQWLQEATVPAFDQGTAVVLDGAPKNLLQALISYGKYHMVLNREPEMERVWKHHLEMADKKFGQSKGQKNRESGAPIQMMAAGFKNRRRGPVRG